MTDNSVCFVQTVNSYTFVLITVCLRIFIIKQEIEEGFIQTKSSSNKLLNSDTLEKI